MPIKLLFDGVSPQIDSDEILYNQQLVYSKCPYAPYKQWARQFGPIYTVWLGEAPIVVITDFELIRDLFVKDGDAYAGRHFLTEMVKEFTASRGKLYGVVRTEGELWKETRRFTLQSMRNLGMGRARLEDRFLKDIGDVIERVRKEITLKDARAQTANDIGISLCDHISRLIGSTINQVLFGHAFSDEHLDDFTHLKHEMDSQNTMMETVTGLSLVGMPFLRHFVPFSWTFEKIDHSWGKLFAHIDKNIAKRLAEREKAKHDGNNNNNEERTAGEANDLLNCFLDNLDEIGAPQQPKCQIVGDEQRKTKQYITNMENIRTVCLDLFLAGQETQRLCNLLPMNLTHRTTTDVQIEANGTKFRLSRGTNIVPQLSCVLYDEKIFPDPHRFIPERFLDQNGQLARFEQLIPFGLGKRSCIGESLARMEMFLFAANFFRHFEVLPVDPLKPPTSEKQKGFAVKPRPYRCRIISRERNNE